MTHAGAGPEADPDDRDASSSAPADVDAGSPSRSGVLGSDSVPTLDQLTVRDLVGDPAEPASSGPLPQFTDFEIEREIGHGGMGIVYLARQRSLQRQVAIKMLLDGAFASPTQRARFISEARVLAGLDHPNIVRVHEAGELNGSLYFAMDYVAGGSLQERLGEHGMQPAAATRLMIPIAQAIQYLHDQKIIHRDLKVSNILIDERHRPRVTDFGLAKFLESDAKLTSSGVVMGTPDYMSPEQAAGKSELVGPRSDVYSLGAILYELLTGRTPFRGSSPMNTIVQVLQTEPKRLRLVDPRIPSDLERICLKCLEKDPDDRYSSAAELARDLERFLVGDPISIDLGGPWKRIRRWVHREPGLAVRWSILLLVNLLGELVIWWQGGYTGMSHEASRAQKNVVIAISVLSALGSWGCQHLLRRGKHTELVQGAWSTLDVLTTMLLLWNLDSLDQLSQAVLALNIVFAGLWVRERLVWLATVLVITSYLSILISHRFTDGPLQYAMRHMVGIIVLIGIGYITAYLTKRLRLLSQLYEPAE